jgi:hypothetical protein
MHPELHRPYWERRARSLACWINLGAWLEHFAPVFFAIATPAAVAIYPLRRQDGVPPPLAYTLGILAALAGLIALWRARPNFFRAAEARVLLESGLLLDNRLTAATEGVAHWPAAQEKPRAVLQWRLEVPAGWLAGAVALLGLSVLAPIGETSALPAFAGPPPSLTQTQEMIGALKALEVASPDALEKLAERAAELVRRPPGSQFEVTAEN